MISATLSSKKLIPIAVISAEILGAFLSGLYAKKSITTPKIAQKTIDKSIAIISGIPFDTAIKVKYAPIISMSPCAKFISFTIP